MAKQRRQIQSGLLHNSAAAYYAAIELHNKPNMPYRYQSVVLLMVNAWELLLKAYIRKYTKTKVEKNGGATIEFSKAVDATLHSFGGKDYKRFAPVADNLRLLSEYRNDFAHYYGSDIEPVLLSLLAKASISYIEFRQAYFPKSRFIDPSLFILPLGFKMPFHPEVIFDPRSANVRLSDEAVAFINSVAASAQRLNDEGIEESVLVSFDVALTNVKQVKNADIVAAVKEGGIPITKEKRVRVVDDPGAAPVMLSDDEFYELYPLSYRQLTDQCRSLIPGFVENRRYHDIRRRYVEDDPQCCGCKSLDKEKKSTRRYFSQQAVNRVKERWQEYSE